MRPRHEATRLPRLATLRSFFAPALLAMLLFAPRAQAQVVQSNLWIPNGPVNAVATSGNSIYIGGIFTQVSPSTGAVVFLDAGTGAVQPPVPMVNGTVNAIAPDGSGGWYLGGEFSAILGQPRANLAQIDASGNLTAWNPAPNGIVEVLTVDFANAKVYVGGTFSSIGGQTRNHLAALDPATGLATAWNPNADANVYALALNGSTVFAGGIFANIGGATRTRLAALDANGVATAWNPRVNAAVHALAVNALQISPFTVTVYAGGDFTVAADSTQRNYLAAFDATGAGATGQATNWNPNPTSSVWALTRDSGSLYAGGVFTKIGGSSGTTRNHLAAFNLSSGALTSWNPNADGSVRCLLVASNSMYVGGDFASMGGQSRPYLANVDLATGAVAGWNPSPDGGVQALAASGTNVCAGGYFRGVGGVLRHNIASLDATTGAATSWNPGATGEVDALVPAGSRIYAGGSFSSVGGFLAGPNLAWIDSSNATGHTFGSPDGQVLALAKSGSKIYVGGEFTHVASVLHPYLAALDSATGGAVAWSPSVAPNFWVRAVSVSGNSLYIGGDFTVVDNLTRNHLAAVNPATGVPTSWNPGANSTVQAILRDSQGTAYAGGMFSTIGTGDSARRYLAALDTTGAATTWNPNPDGQVRTLMLGANLIYVGGAFNNIGGGSRPNAAALGGATGVATAWNPQPDNVVQCLAAGGNSIYLGGAFTSTLGTIHPFLSGVSGDVTAVGEPPAARAAAGSLLRAAPNPFRSATALSFRLLLPGAAEARIYDPSGRLVRQLHPGWLAAGDQRLAWDGRDSYGRAVAPGVYVASIRAAGETWSGKLVRLK